MSKKMVDEALIKILKETMKHLFRFFTKWVLALLLIIYVSSGFYSIPQNEVGVLQRFGKIINREVKPGMHYALPYPVDKSPLQSGLFLTFLYCNIKFKKRLDKLLF
jgi:hypothetical protein